MKKLVLVALVVLFSTSCATSYSESMYILSAKGNVTINDGQLVWVRDTEMNINPDELRSLYKLANLYEIFIVDEHNMLPAYED